MPTPRPCRGPDDSDAPVAALRPAPPASLNSARSSSAAHSAPAPGREPSCVCARARACAFVCVFVWERARDRVRACVRYILFECVRACSRVLNVPPCVRAVCKSACARVRARCTLHVRVSALPCGWRLRVCGREQQNRFAAMALPALGGTLSVSSNSTIFLRSSTSSLGRHFSLTVTIAFEG